MGQIKNIKLHIVTDIKIHVEMDITTISLADLQNAYQKLKEHSHLCYTTPVIEDVGQQYQHVLQNQLSSLSFKLETMQYTGSFKARGTAYQFLSLSSNDMSSKRTLVTMSAGNYGKAFAHMAKYFDIPAVVFMPDNAPQERRAVIEACGAIVHQCPVPELIPNVSKHQHDHGSLYLHSYDDPVLIVGHASAGLELMEQVTQQPDIVVVCCGGGGFLAGVSLGLKLNGWQSTKIYGVEPEKGPRMFNAINAGKVVPTALDGTCIATGLMPPTAGVNAFSVIQKHVDGIILVSDEEIIKALNVLYLGGMVVEPSGAAAFAGVMCGKIPDADNKNVVVFLTGSNVSPKDLARV